MTHISTLFFFNYYFRMEQQPFHQFAVTQFNHTSAADVMKSIDESEQLPSGMRKIVWMYWEQGLEHLRTVAGDRTKKYAADSRCVDAMIHLNPNWKVIVLDKMSASSDLAPLFDSLMQDKTTASRIRPRMRANILRLELLSRYGGVWSDTSNCPFQELDTFVPKWLGTNPEAFFSPRSELSFSSIGVDDFPKNASSCHNFKDVPGNLATGFRTLDNWFLASASPHNPLVDQWLSIYHDHLVNHPDPRNPYFLAQCSLTQAIVKNSTVEEVWINTVRRWDRLQRSGWKMKRPCFDGGEKIRDIGWYWKHCAFVKKQKSKHTRDYVLSPEYMNDITHNSQNSSLSFSRNTSRFAFATILGKSPDENQNQIYYDAVRVLIRSIKASGTNTDISEWHIDFALKESFLYVTTLNSPFCFASIYSFSCADDGPRHGKREHVES